MTLEYIFSKQFLFNPTPGSESGYYIPLIVVFGSMLLASFLIRFFKMDKKIQKRQTVSYLTIGILGFIYLGARYENLPWLGSRLFLALIIFTALVWLTYLSVWGFKYNEIITKEKLIEDKYNKYLPKRRKK